jgi:4-hydroxy-tetrahydrodipicolinate synthase
MHQSLEGVLVAAITPRRENGCEVDLGAALELVDYLSASGVNGIALLGSTGEFIHFDIAERIRLVSFAARRSRVPVIAGVGHSTLEGGLMLAREAAASGAAAVLVPPPYFFRYQQRDIREFYLRFAESVGDAVPLLLYNIPFFTNPIACETAVELLSTGAFCGIKDSSGDFDYFLGLRPVCQAKGLKLLVGHDSIFVRARLEGASGLVSGVASAVPELLVALDAAVRGDRPLDCRERLEARVHEFIAWILRFPMPVGIREATRLRGLKTGPFALPVDERLLAEFREWFLAWLPVVQKETKADG